jgi:hypothetical protein
MGALMPEVDNRLEVEKAELNWLLNSGLLGRSNNFSRVLTYICEKHFQIQDEQITEHSIAVEALGRRSNFDPQSDTIVRVVTRSLRKRLQEVYETAGLNRPVQIVIPTGHYAPSFIHRIDGASIEGLVAPEAPNPAAANAPGPEFKPGGVHHLRWRVAALAAATLILLGGILFMAHRNALAPLTPGPKQTSAALPQPKNSVHALMGTGRHPYLDHSGFSWTPEKYCSSGDSVTLPDQKIAGTEDPYLYLGGIRGIAHCIFPVNPGLHEIHFYFAETSDLPTATRPASLAINAGPGISFDVVDHAGGDGIATSMVLTGVPPEADGAIHVDYTSEVSLLNAVEILPADSDSMLPVRITTSPVSITDSASKVWLSDRYFSGGRRGQFSDLTKADKNSIYRYNRIGRFRYDIPAVPFQKYRITLYFSEPWFGKQNSGTGGPGSRIFDLSCNGNMILKNFDILAEGGTSPVEKTFDNIEATGQGKIELFFIPEVNYPLVNAIEVLPQPSR